MKIFSLAPKENWIIDRIVKEWNSNNSEMACNSARDSDVLWVISPWLWRNIPISLLKEKKVVVTIHHIVPQKFTKNSLREFLERDQYVDWYHVPCQKTKVFISKITKKPIKVMSFWYNPALWYPVEKTHARESLDVPKDTYVVGNFQRDTEGSDLISPKLEKGPDLFIETVKKINKNNLLVLLGGWRRQYVINRLDEENIPYKYIEMAPYNVLRNMYAACDLYVVASRTEGGPQAILEAAAMKVPIISRDVGIASSILDKKCIVDVPKELYFPVKADVESCYNNVLRYKLDTHINQFKKFFNNLEQE